MLAIDVMKPIQTEKASPVLLVLKREGPLLFSLAYRNLDSIDYKGLQQISHMTENIHSFARVAILAKLDPQYILTTQNHPGRLPQDGFSILSRTLSIYVHTDRTKVTPKTFQRGMDF